MVYLQVKLCDPCLSALRYTLYIVYKRRYMNTLLYHQDNNRKARFPLHSTSHLELAAKDSSGQ